jgi:hypothetical protein
MGNLAGYDFVLIENASLNSSAGLELESYVASGNVVFLSEDLLEAGGDVLNITFTKGATVLANATFVSDDRYLDFVYNDTISVPLNSTVADLDSSYFKTLAVQDSGRRVNAVAAWDYGQGSVYYFSSFDSAFSGSGGDFYDYIEEAAEQYINDNLINATLDFSGIDSSNLVRLSRVAVYSREPVFIEIYTWN